MKVSHVKSFSKYSMLDGSNGPLITSMDFIVAFVGRTLFERFVAVLELKQEENPCEKEAIIRTSDYILRKIFCESKLLIFFPAQFKEVEV